MKYITQYELQETSIIFLSCWFTGKNYYENPECDKFNFMVFRNLNLAANVNNNNILIVEPKPEKVIETTNVETEKVSLPIAR